MFSTNCDHLWTKMGDCYNCAAELIRLCALYQRVVFFAHLVNFVLTAAAPLLNKAINWSGWIICLFQLVCFQDGFISQPWYNLVSGQAVDWLAPRRLSSSKCSKALSISRTGLDGNLWTHLCCEHRSAVLIIEMGHSALRHCVWWITI